MRLSIKGEFFLKLREELRLIPYMDPGGRWTWGWGHLMTLGENHDRVRTVEEAKEQFNSDLRPHVAAVNNLVIPKLEQHQFDALVIFAFNIGIPRFTGSTILRLINIYGTEYDRLEEWWKVWNKVTNPDTHVLEVNKGLVNRRAAEWKLFKDGDYGS